MLKLSKSARICQISQKSQFPSGIKSKLFILKGCFTVICKMYMVFITET